MCDDDPSWINDRGLVGLLRGCTSISISPRCAADDDDDVAVAVARLITAQQVIALCCPVNGWENSSLWGNKLSPRGAA